MMAFRLCVAVAAVVACVAAAVDWRSFDGVAQVTNRDGSILYRASHGYFSYPHHVPMFHNAQFPIASNTKLFTAVALYQLQEQGLLNITDNIAAYLNATDFAAFGFPNVTTYCPVLANRSESQDECQVITFRHLLSMSSGIYAEMRCDPQAGMAAYCNKSPFVLFPGTIGAMVGTFIMAPLAWIPGTAYEYSNPNFILAAHLIERISGMSYGDYIQQHILNVVGLRDTYFDLFNNQFQLNPRRVNEYHHFIDADNDGATLGVGQNTVDFDLGSLSGTGGLVSTVDDMNLWYRTLFNFSAGGAPLFKEPASLQALLGPWTPMVPPAVVPTFYAQGVTIVCAQGDTQCANGPTFVIYEGGTICVHTANILDVRALPNSTERRYQMTQVFSSSLLYNTTKTLFDIARRKGGANFFELAAEISYPTPDAMELAWGLQAVYGPSPLSP